MGAGIPDEAVEVTNGMLRVLWLKREGYFRLTGDLGRPTEFSGAFPFDTRIEQKRSTEQRIREALSSYWVESTDFEVDEWRLSDGSLGAPRNCGA